MEERIQPDDMARIMASRQAAELATYKARTVELEVRLKYGLKLDDAIELPSGRVTRAPQPTEGDDHG